MTAFLLASDLDPGALLERLRGMGEAVADVVRGGEGNLIDAIQTPEQRRDPRPPHRRDDAGRGPRRLRHGRRRALRWCRASRDIRAKFQHRREGAGQVDRTIRRLLGLDLKMKQYAEGSRFVNKVIEQVGMESFNRVWTSPNTLPTHAEIKDPGLWVGRVVGNPELPPAETP